ncbi:MAG: alpha/beta fold hydrolase [Thermoleophilaceae bacterium]
MPHVLRRPRLYYERQGAGEPLLFITGFTISSAVFEPVVPLYRNAFECITYDNRGSGRSDAALRPISIPELAHDAVRLLDALEIESAHVYGLSMGGMIAQELALRFPDRVRGLVLGCSTPGGPLAARPALRELRALGAAAAGALREPGRPWLSAMLFSEEFRREQPQEVRTLLRHFERHRALPHSAAAHLLASIYHDTVSRLDQIQAPTLVLHGERDAMSPLANARMLAERIPDAELAIIPGAGHAYLLERPGESLDVTSKWFGRHSPIAAGRARRGLIASAEPLTRAFGLPVGAARTGRSLVGYAAGHLGGNKSREGETHVAVD